MTGARPEPRWGQYADQTPTATQPPKSPEAPEVARQRRTVDRVVATALLLLGVFEVIIQWPQYLMLGTLMKQVYSTQGFGEFSHIDSADSAGLVLNVIRLIFLVVAIIFSLLFIARNRRVLWIPLSAGVLAWITVAIVMLVLMTQDPALGEFVQRSGLSGD